MRRPLSKRQASNQSPDWDGLHEGVPDWLVQFLLDWSASFFVTRGYESYERDRKTLHAIEVSLRRPLNWAVNNQGAWNDLCSAMVADREFMLDVIDWCVARVDALLLGVPDVVSGLDRALAAGGSAWTVGRDGGGVLELQRRIAPEVVAAIESSSTSNTRSATHLRVAFSKAYGRDPSASESYRESVRAVEVAAIPVISPNNAAATLGTMIRDIQQKPEKWQTVFRPPDSLIDMQVVISMMELLWKSQLDRHGTPDAATPLNVSREEAEAALHLAATLVHWFTSGAVVQI